MNGHSDSDIAWAPEAPPAPRARSARDWVGALRRRIWLIALVSLALGGAGTVFTMMQAPVYLATGRMVIEAPRPIVDGIGDTAPNTQAAQAFFATRMQLLSSRKIAEQVFAKVKLSNWGELNGASDKVVELMEWMTVKQVKDSNLVEVSFRAGDPELAARIVNETMETLIAMEKDAMTSRDQASMEKIKGELTALMNAGKSREKELNEFFQKNQGFLVGGTGPLSVNLDAARHQLIEQDKIQTEMQVGKLRKNIERIKEMINDGAPMMSEFSTARINESRDLLRGIDSALEKLRGQIRPDKFESNSQVVKLLERKADVDNTLNEMLLEESGMQLSAYETELKTAEAHLEELKQKSKEAREAALKSQEGATKLSEIVGSGRLNEETREMLARESIRRNMSGQLTAIRMDIIDEARKPTEPIRPIKEIQIPLLILAGILVACGLAMALELMDNSIRLPEQATASLDWPLLGVIPRFHPRELMDQGRPTLVSELPGSRAFESFRSLRMGLLGAETREPLRSVLVTSARPDEGKSFVAANLAATCARAGESVLLVDIDLRESTLAERFNLGPDAIGLIDALEGNVPWERAVVATDVPNLTLMPTGDAAGVPVEVLGTAEMHNLLVDWMQKFDRVILDGPATLGLADAREVGRFTDGVVFVMRAGSHDPRPLQRIREMFRHEGLRTAGIVFNGMKDRCEDTPLVGANRRPAPRRRRPEAMPTPAAASIAADVAQEGDPAEAA